MGQKEAVCSIVKHGSDILIVKKVDDGGKSLISGQWHLPGETKKLGETNEQAVARGILEEAAIFVTGIRFLIDSVTPKETLLHWYECDAESRNIIPGDDVVEARFVPKSEVSIVCSSFSIQMWPKKIRKYFDLNDIISVK